MKMLTTTLIAAALALPGFAAPALAAPGHPDNHGKQVSKTAHRNFKKGDTFDKRYAANYREIDYRQYKRLKAPPRGYHYVRSGNDVLLVALTSGVVASVLTGMFN